MIILWIFLLFLCIWGISYSHNNDYERYLSKDQTNSIKGIFILIVFLSHVNGYIRISGYAYDAWGDGSYSFILSIIGQLMVVMFLFYSGYGVMESIFRKGNKYVKSMPKHRILNTLVNFDVAVFIFLVVDFLVGRDVSITQFLLSLIAWESVGNSSWYIFAILFCYTATWLVANLVYNKTKIGGGVFLVLSILAVCLFFVKESWWYNTLLAYSVGIQYSINRKTIEALFSKHFYLVFIGLFIVFFVVFRIPFELMGFRTNILSILFALLIVMLTLRVKIGNPVLRWCGEQLFPIYIYQRIPMIVLGSLMPSIITESPFLYAILCLFFTLIVTFFYKYIRVSL